MEKRKEVSEDSVRSLLCVAGEEPLRKLCAYLASSRDPTDFPLLFAPFPFLMGQLRAVEAETPDQPVRQTTRQGNAESIHYLRLRGLLPPTSLVTLLRLLAEEQGGTFKAQLRSRPHCTPVNTDAAGGTGEAGASTFLHPWDHLRVISYHDGHFHFVPSSTR